MIKTQLLIIDPQNDFCYPGFNTFANVVGFDPRSESDIPSEWYKEGALYVPGAFDDMIKLSKMIERVGNKLYDITVTLDSHHYLDVAHPIYWVSGSDGKTHPDSFTIITPDDIDNGVWRCFLPAWQKNA